MYFGSPVKRCEGNPNVESIRESLLGIVGCGLDAELERLLLEGSWEVHEDVLYAESRKVAHSSTARICET